MTCGSHNVAKPPLCRFCAKSVYSLIPKEKVCRADSLPIQSLFRWSPVGPRCMAVLARALKNSQKEDWLPFAEWFAQRLAIPPGGVIVPAPPRKWGCQDHAWGWAWALSTVTGLPLRSPLMRVHTRSQKDLSRLARAQIRIELAEAEWNCSDYRSVIVVDDVVTTGSTVKACYTALGRPPNSIVWTVFGRMPCDAASRLI